MIQYESHTLTEKSGKCNPGVGLHGASLQRVFGGGSILRRGFGANVVRRVLVMRILLDQLGALARVLLKVAFVLELATHVARHGAVAAAFAEAARLTGLLGSRPLPSSRAGRLAIILADAVSVHHVGFDARVILSVEALR